MKLSRNQINKAITAVECNRTSAVKQLQELDYQTKKAKYSNVPDYAISAGKFEDSSTNGLTECVIRWLQLNGHYCTRIQSQGQWNTKLGRFTKSTVKRGIGDIMAIVKSQTLMIEIKTGSDRQSHFQKETENEVLESGGIYLIVRNFAAFLNFYKTLII